MSTGPVVVPVGPMGVGKSTVGRLAAEQLGVGCRDTHGDTAHGARFCPWYGSEAGWRG